MGMIILALVTTLAIGTGYVAKRVFWRRAALPFAAMTLIVSLCLWVWTSGVYYRTLPTPACAIRLPFVLLQACGDDDGLHFLALKEHANQFPAIQFGRATYLGNGGYRLGHVVNILGLVLALLPTEYDGGDYIVAPHIALVLPYWLLIVASGYLLVVVTPVASWMAPYCRLSKLSGGAAGFVCVLFAILSVVPSAWRPGAAIQPRTFHEWVTITLEPQAAYSEIMLVYGFPFSCYRRGIINGKTVNLFYGANIGWEPHKAMENACVTVFAACVVMLGVQWIRHRVATGTAQQAVQVDTGNGGDSGLV